MMSKKMVRPRNASLMQSARFIRGLEMTIEEN